MLAIIIPYFKLTFFEETLRSLANQTDKRFKVYIGDDASLENPTDLLEKYKGKFDFEYHRFEYNLGGTSLTQQWDRCIALSADEEWIMILGDDDYLVNTVVSSWYKNYNEFYQKSEVIRFSTKIFYQETNTSSNFFEHPLYESATDSYWRKHINISRSSLSEYVFSKYSYNKFGFYNYPLAWNSDDHAWLVFSDSKPIFSINESTVFVRLSTLNISGKSNNFVLKDKSQILFYSFLIRKKFVLYDTNQRKDVLRSYENQILKSRKLTYSEWLFVLLYTVKYLKFDTLKLTKRFFKTIFN